MCNILPNWKNCIYVINIGMYGSELKATEYIFRYQKNNLISLNGIRLKILSRIPAVCRKFNLAIQGNSDIS